MDKVFILDPVHHNWPLLRNGVVCVVSNVVDLGPDSTQWRWRTWCGDVIDQPGYEKLKLTPTCLGCIANQQQH